MGKLDRYDWTLIAVGSPLPLILIALFIIGVLALVKRRFGEKWACHPLTATLITLALLAPLWGVKLYFDRW